MIDINDDSFKSTLKEASKDNSDKDNIVFMTESDLEVISFDAIKTKYANALNLSEDVAHSVDALLVKEQNLDNDIFFIEFKNGKVDGKIKRNIANKVRDSLLIYNDIQTVSISDLRKHAVLILVYNESKNIEGHHRDYIAQSVMSFAKEELIRFDLERFKHLYFREVHTYTENQFEEFLKETF